MSRYPVSEKVENSTTIMKMFNVEAGDSVSLSSDAGVGVGVEVGNIPDTRIGADVKCFFRLLRLTLYMKNKCYLNHLCKLFNLHKLNNSHNEIEVGLAIIFIALILDPTDKTKCLHCSWNLIR